MVLRTDDAIRPPSSGVPLLQAPMAMTVMSQFDKADSIEVVFYCSDARTQNLSNYYLRWVPIVPELQSLERAMQKIEPELKVRWDPLLEKYWSRYDPNLAVTTQGMTFTSSPWMSVGWEACHSLHVMSVVPVVTIQVAENPRASWISASLLFDSHGPPDSAHWSCRPEDLIAIVQMIARFGNVAVTAPTSLMKKTERKFRLVEPIPRSRLRK